MAFAVLAHSFFRKPQFVTYTTWSPWGLAGSVFDIMDMPRDQIPCDFTMLREWSSNPLFSYSSASDCWGQSYL